MLHIVATFCVIIALVAFATSVPTARVMVGIALATAAAAVLFVIGIAALDIARQSAARPQSVVHHGSGRI